MRTAISTAAPPRHLRWQAAFTTKAYQTLSPVVWHHAFVSDTHDELAWRLRSIFDLGFRQQPRWESQDGQHPGRHRSPLVSPSTNLNVEGVAGG